MIKEKHFKTLGLDKILEVLALKVDAYDAKQKIFEIQPSSNIDTVKRLLDETSTAHSLIARYKAPSFVGLKKVDSQLLRASTGGQLSTKDLLNIAEVLSVFESIFEFKKSFVESVPALENKFESIYTNKTLRKKISTAILSENEIADEASPNLLNIRRKIKFESNRIRLKLDKIIRSATFQKYMQDSIVTIREGRFVIPVKSEYKSNVSGIIHDTSATGATVFIEPISVVESNNEIRILKNEEKKEIEKILWELSKNVGIYAEKIKSSYQIAIDLNVIFAKAELAYSMKAFVPKINSEGKIELKKARHPLIDKKNVVPIDINLGLDFDTLIITGPNTGGKTVSLKTVGLLTLMTMCGLMIPAEENSSIAIFENILADIGDEQSIEQSLSTFSSHMKNIIEILENTDEKTLVLLDELGAGTDPIEGAALANAILEELRKKGSKIIATTHYAELKTFALTTSKVENGSFEFDIKSLKPTYKLLIGTPGSSNAFAISQKLGIESHIVERAKNLVSDENIKFEKVIKSLEKNRIESEKYLKKAKILHEEIKKEKDNLENEKLKFKKQREIEINKARHEAQKIVFKTTSKSNQILKRLEELEKTKSTSKDTLRLLKKDIENMEKSSDPVIEKTDDGYKLPRKLKVGDEVLIFDIDKKATVLEIHSNSEATVHAGIIKTRVPIKNLRLLKQKKTTAQTRSTTKNVKSKMSTKLFREIDLRGLTALEATVELDKFIDDAILSGINQITIIHGKGTGVLRKEVWNYLKSHPNIKKFRLGNFGEGESGVTIAEF